MSDAARLILDRHAAAALDAWRGHSVRLASFAALSLAAAIALWFASAGPDGRDPFYVALAIEFAVWGAINLFFGIGGTRDAARMRRAGDDDATLTKAVRIARLLRFNHWLNALWLTTGAGLLAWGYAAEAPGIVGHGVGVLSQAIVLTALDLGFVRGLRVATR